MSEFRLAYHPEGGRTLSDMKSNQPVIRLAVSPIGNTGANSVAHHTGAAGLGHPAPSVRLATKANSGREASNLHSPAVRLAHIDGAQGDCVLQGTKGRKRLPVSMAPALLVSYFYLKPFLANQARYCYRDWVMDSGAFSAKESGVTIHLQDYIKTCRKLLAEDPTLTEVYALDVIGNHRASAENARIMWEEGIPAIPCFHYGSPEAALMEIAEKYPKIAIGGCARMRGSAKLDFAKQVFARVWPKRIHGFGFGSEKAILALPFHSVDATNWEIGPCKFGRWNSFGNMSVRGSDQNLRKEVEYYLRVEEKARAKWRPQMAQLAALPDPGLVMREALIGNAPARQPAPKVRLAVDFGSAGGKRASHALEDQTVRTRTRTRKKK